LQFVQRLHRLLQRGILAIVEVWNAVAAYRRISEAGAKFVSRGDNSRTHQKEMSVWNAAKIKPEGTW
jgi:tungstate transport system substrate-binding protein